MNRYRCYGSIVMFSSLLLACHCMFEKAKELKLGKKRAAS